MLSVFRAAREWARVFLNGLARLATSRVFRALLAGALIAGHLMAVRTMAHQTYGLPFNSNPGYRLGSSDAPLSGGAIAHWNRLVVARWDSAHYIDLVIRGHKRCPHGRVELTNAIVDNCHLNFYPGYPFLGWLVSLGGRWSPDYAMFALSLASSWVFLFAWTGPTMVEGLGLRATYASLAAFNVFPSAYTMVTILTEPCVLVLTLTSFLCLRRKHYLLGALLAGAATGLRISGAAVGAAYALALCVAALLERPRGALAWSQRAVALVLSMWGFFALCIYYYVRFRDPLMYVHAHSLSYNHSPAFLRLLWPNPLWIKHALYDPFHVAIWVFMALLWFALGHRRALWRFPLDMQVFCYVLFALSWFISVSGTLTLGLPGNSRYMLALLPSFFAIGALLKNRPAALALWLVASGWFYWNQDLCHFVGGVGLDRFYKCHDETVSDGGY